MKLSDIPYVVRIFRSAIDRLFTPAQDNPTIVFNAKESVEMPFRYIVENNEPLLPPGMKEHLYDDLNKSFDF